MRKNKWLPLLLTAALFLTGCELPSDLLYSGEEQTSSQSVKTETAQTESSGDSADLHSTYAYYYTVLNTDEQAIYDAALRLLQTPADNTQRITVQISIDPSSDDFKTQRQVAITALRIDHPEFFWFIGRGSITYTYQNSGSGQSDYEINMRLTDSYKTSEPEITMLESAVDAFLSDIDLSMPDSEIALAIHDKLIDTVTYDEELYESAEETGGDGSDDYGYTIYGALVENSRGEANTAVCEGYSQAYEYLCQQAGLTVTRVSGQAGSVEEDGTQSLEAHSWNLVQLEDGQWYEIDATWDDREADSLTDTSYADVFESAMSDDSFRDQVQHAFFNRTTEEMSNFDPGDTYTWRMEDGRGITFFGPSVHIRDSGSAEDNPEAYLTGLAPTAEGTVYAYPY